MLSFVHDENELLSMSSLNCHKTFLIMSTISVLFFNFPEEKILRAFGCSIPLSVDDTTIFFRAGILDYDMTQNTK